MESFTKNPEIAPRLHPKRSFAQRSVALHPIGKSLIYIVSRLFGVFERALKGLRANRCTIAAWSENDFHNYRGNAGNPPYCCNCTVVQCTRNEIAQRLTVSR